MTERDGYYTVSAICLVLGLLSVVFYMIPTARKLQGKVSTYSILFMLNNCVSAIPPSRWRVFS